MFLVMGPGPSFRFSGPKSTLPTATKLRFSASFSVYGSRCEITTVTAATSLIVAEQAAAFIRAPAIRCTIHASGLTEYVLLDHVHSISPVSSSSLHVSRLCDVYVQSI